MTAINHSLTGVAIGVMVQSSLAFPLAFLSHFFLDSLPHFGLSKRNNIFIVYLAIDVILTGGLLIWLLIASNQPFLLVGCLLFATAPDIIWAYRWFKELKYQQPFSAFNDPLTKFHAKIQWFEKPIGIIFEICWAVAMGLVIVNNI